MKNHKLGYAGSFDPPTVGHIWVIKEALDLADEVVIFIASNHAKKHLFSDQERLNMMKEALKEQNINKNVKIQIADGRYIAQIALSSGCTRLIRGARNATDFEYEAQLQRANSELLGGIKTIFVMPPKDLEAVSSSFIKSLIGPPGWHWILDPLLPKASRNALIQKRLQMHAQNARLGIEGPSLEWVLNESHWASKDRFYHTPIHLCHVLDELVSRVGTGDIQLLQAAFAHDLIYKAQPDDEEQSVKAWHQAGGIECTDLVLSTGHAQSKVSLNPKSSSALLCGADLAILASPNKVYRHYVDLVQKEWLQLRPDISLSMFNTGRCEFLKKMIHKAQKNKLFIHPLFENYNASALINLQMELAERTAGVPSNNA